MIEPSEQAHLSTLGGVFQRVEFVSNKSNFLAELVEYLGHCIDEKGLCATDEKLQAIVQAPPPKNVQELISFLGLINYYGRFFQFS